MCVCGGGGGFNNYQRIPVVYEGLLFPYIRIDGNFVVNRHKYRGSDVYQLGINYGKGDTRNIKFFNELKEKVDNLCKKFEGPVVIGEPNFFDEGKPWSIEWERNINAKIHSTLLKGVRIPAWKLVKANGKNKKKSIDIENIAKKRFHGSCMISINDVLVTDSLKTINLEVGEILVKEMGFTESHFKEYEIFRDEDKECSCEDFDSNSDSD